MLRKLPRCFSLYFMWYFPHEFHDGSALTFILSFMRRSCTTEAQCYRMHFFFVHLRSWQGEVYCFGAAALGHGETQPWHHRLASPCAAPPRPCIIRRASTRDGCVPILGSVRLHCGVGAPMVSPSGGRGGVIHLMSACWCPFGIPSIQLVTWIPPRHPDAHEPA